MSNKKKILVTIAIMGCIGFILWLLGFTWVYRSLGIIVPERITVSPPDYKVTFYDDVQKDSWIDKIYERVGLIQGELDWSLAKIPLSEVVNKSREITNEKGLQDSTFTVSLVREARGVHAYYMVNFSTELMPSRAVVFFTGNDPNKYKFVDFNDDSSNVTQHER